MLSQSLTLLPNTSTVGAILSDSYRAAGYYNLGQGLHTIVVDLHMFKGHVTLQGTLSMNPNDADWFNIHDQTYGDDSTEITNIVSSNFYGNFVWIRAIGVLDSGSISSIMYNF